eukprot:augustus_masked-scaffold_5-processed-gene-10.49-mRNA-1 protein AED:0.17 eAED:1.00 QI:0/-1/0/1/-1/1/1/0/205
MFYVFSKRNTKGSVVNQGGAKRFGDHSAIYPVKTTNYTSQPARSATFSQVQPCESRLARSGEEKVKEVRRVRFEQGSKTWDGPEPDNRDFDELLFCFLVKGKAVGDADILRWTGADVRKISALLTLLKNIIHELQTTEANSVPCLARGGGRALRIEKLYLPYLLSLLDVLKAALAQAQYYVKIETTQMMSTNDSDTDSVEEKVAE